MKTVCTFRARFASLVVWVRSGFDRVIFQGHRQINRASAREQFVDYLRKVKRVEGAKQTAPPGSERLVECAKRAKR